LASFTVASGKCVQYDGKMLYGGNGTTYTVADNRANYLQSLTDISAGNITIVAGFTNNVNLTEQYLSVDANLAQAAWNTVASHKVFNVTGAVRMRMYNECTVAGVNTAGSAQICYGLAGSTSAFIAQTPISQFGIGDMWIDATPAETHATYGSAIIDQVIVGGVDVGYEITGSAPSGGTIRFHCLWTPLSADGAVTAGTGSALS
jgi:hypothetical protein